MTLAVDDGPGAGGGGGGGGGGSDGRRRNTEREAEDHVVDVGIGEVRAPASRIEIKGVPAIRLG